MSDTTDSLTRLLEMQERLQREAYGRNLAAMQPEERVDFIKNMVLAATDELHEALNETAWKPWASGYGEIQRDAFFGELVDLFHFVMNLMLAGRPDLTPAEVAAELVVKYKAKNAKNLRRQLDGYDGKSNKCPGCRRALDDDAVRCRRVTVDDFEGEHRFWCSHDATFFHADGSRAPS